VFQEWLDQPIAEPRLDEFNCGRADASLRVLVVGAGPAGLAGMAELKRAGVPLVGVESHARVGGIWDRTNAVSAVYEGMQTVTSRYTTHLGTPLAADTPNYLPNEQAHQYLLSFAEREQLHALVRFSTSFVDARKTPRGTWLVKLQPATGDAYEEEFRGIVFATGAHNRKHTSMPHELAEQARAAGLRVLHSADYKGPESFADQRVLIIGIGNSGSDIADRISRVAKRTLVAVRNTPWINPQIALGTPCDKLAADTPSWTPYWFRLSTFHVIRWLSVGGYRRLGLKRPRHGMNERVAISDRGIVDALRSGRVIARSHVTDLRGGIARFADPAHASEAVDVVIMATGFARRYPLLDAPGMTSDDVAGQLSFLMFHKREPGLAYLAETVGQRGCWPIFAEQARAIAAFYRAEQEGTANARRFATRRSLPTPNFKGALFARADAFHIDYDIYVQALRELSAWLAA
jgi:cation diffusion facilitator CzcD-associated flavoprotein CzcO